MRQEVSDRLVSFIDLAQRSLATPVTRDTFAAFVEPWGFASFSIAEVWLKNGALLLGRQSGQARRNHVWEYQYAANGFIRDDPVAMSFLTTRESHGWAEIFERAPKTRRVQQLRSQAGAYGFHDGFIVPIRNNGISALAVTLGGAKIDDDPAVQKALELAARVYSDRFTVLSASADVPIEAPVLQRARLTDRERLCLEWVGRGKTDRDIGTILGIGGTTVTWHVKRAMEKLQATSRTHAFAIAVSIGEASLSAI